MIPEASIIKKGRVPMVLLRLLRFFTSTLQLCDWIAMMWPAAVCSVRKIGRARIAFVFWTAALFPEHHIL